jgi:hypothetical protein
MWIKDSINCKKVRDCYFIAMPTGTPWIGTKDSARVLSDSDKDGGSGSIIERKNVNVIVISARIVNTQNII